MIVLTALLLADGRLYEAAESLRTPTLRKFLTITLPGAKFGLVSATMVVFSYTVSDFGIPKVIGGNFNVLAVDIYKQVIGQQNFNKGAVVSLVLLVPRADRLHRRLDHAAAAAGAVLGARGSLCAASATPWFDRTMFVYCLVSRGADARRAGDGGLHVVHQVLALRQVAQPAALPVRADRRRRAVVVLQQPEDGACVAVGGTMFIFGCRLPAGEDARHAADQIGGAPACRHSDGRAGHGAGLGLHPVLQRPGQPAARASTGR